MTSARSKLEVGIAAALLVLAAGCKHNTTGEVETETHFLRSCQDACDQGLTCVCGVCTATCSGDAACAKHGANATCMTTPAACDSEVASACDVECTADRDCRALGASYACTKGRCRGAAAPDAAGTGAQVPPAVAARCRARWRRRRLRSERSRRSERRGCLHGRGCCLRRGWRRRRRIDCGQRRVDSRHRLRPSRHGLLRSFSAGRSQLLRRRPASLQRRQCLRSRL